MPKLPFSSIRENIKAGKFLEASDEANTFLKDRLPSFYDVEQGIDAFFQATIYQEEIKTALALRIEALEACLEDLRSHFSEEAKEKIKNLEQTLFDNQAMYMRFMELSDQDTVDAFSDINMSGIFAKAEKNIDDIVTQKNTEINLMKKRLIREKKQKKYEVVIALYKQLLFDYHQQDYAIYVDLGKTYALMNEENLALCRVARKDAEDSRLATLAVAGLSGKSLENHQYAQMYLHQALSLAPKRHHAEIYKILAELYDASGAYQQAVFYYKKFCALQHEDFYEFYYKLTTSEKNKKCLYGIYRYDYMSRHQNFSTYFEKNAKTLRSDFYKQYADQYLESAVSYAEDVLGNFSSEEIFSMVAAAGVQCILLSYYYSLREACLFCLRSSMVKNKPEPGKLYLAIEDHKIIYKTDCTPDEKWFPLEGEIAKKDGELYLAISKKRLVNISSLCKEAVLEIISKRGHGPSAKKTIYIEQYKNIFLNHFSAYVFSDIFGLLSKEQLSFIKWSFSVWMNAYLKDGQVELLLHIMRRIDYAEYEDIFTLDFLKELGHAFSKAKYIEDAFNIYTVYVNKNPDDEKVLSWFAKFHLSCMEKAYEKNFNLMLSKDNEVGSDRPALIVSSLHEDVVKHRDKVELYLHQAISLEEAKINLNEEGRSFLADLYRDLCYFSNLNRDFEGALNACRKEGEIKKIECISYYVARINDLSSFNRHQCYFKLMIGLSAVQWLLNHELLASELEEEIKVCLCFDSAFGYKVLQTRFKECARYLHVAAIQSLMLSYYFSNYAGIATNKIMLLFDGTQRPNSDTFKNIFGGVSVKTMLCIKQAYIRLIEVYLSLSRFDCAVELFEHIRQESGGDTLMSAQFLFDMGAACYAKKNLDLAIFAYEGCLKKQNDFPGAKEKYERLMSILKIAQERQGSSLQISSSLYSNNSFAVKNNSVELRKTP